MIIFDFTQVAISAIIEVLGPKPTDIALIRHVCLNTIRAHVVKFRSRYPGEIVLACDTRHYWRRDKFQFYKAHRAEERKESGTDWEFIFDSIAILKEEFKKNLPYHVIEIDKVEADDIIAVLIRRCRDEKSLIISSDHDFKQLLIDPKVEQYAPSLKMMIRCDDPETFKWKHIFCGDPGDGVPNVLMQDDAIFNHIRQKPMTVNRLSDLMEVFRHGRGTAPDDVAKRVIRNRELVDFDYIPDLIEERINVAYDASTKASKRAMMSYFVEKDLHNLFDVITDF